MKPERIQVHIEVLDDGRMRARTLDEVIVAHGEHIAELRRNVDEAVRERFGGPRPVALMVGRAAPMRAPRQ